MSIDITTLALAKEYTNRMVGSGGTGGGVDGGYYTPGVTQPTTDTMQISFAPSKSDMPAVNPVTVNLPVSENSGQNVTIDATLTRSGAAADAKAVGDALDELESKIPSIEGLAKTEEIPTKPGDIGAQPKGNYASPDDIPKVPSWAMQASKPGYTASEVGADPQGEAASAVNAHNANTDAHTDLRLEIRAIREQLAAFLDVDEETLNELSELIARIVANQTSIAQLTTGKVNVADIIDNLTTNAANKPLSAAQGVVLNGLIYKLSASLVNYQPKGNYLTEAPVESVNGKTGAVVLDIKALGGYTQAEVDAIITSLKAQGIQQTPALAQGTTLNECLAWLDVNGDTAKVYIMPKSVSNYVYGYILTETEPEPLFTNMIDGAEIKTGYRYSLSSKAFKAQTGCDAVVFQIPSSGSITIRLRNCECNTNYPQVYGGTSATAFSNSHITDASGWNTDGNGDQYCTFANSAGSTYVCVMMNTADTSKAIVTVNEEIAYTAGGISYAWANTGHAFVPADYEDRIIDIEKDVANHKDQIAEIAAKIENIGADASEEVAINRIRNWQYPIFEDAPVFLLNENKPALTASDMTTAGIYAKYDALMAANSHYITRVDCGTASDGTTPIYAYHFRQPVPHYLHAGAGQWSEKKPTFLVCSGVHPTEQTGVHCMFHAMEEITTNPKLTDLRRNLHFIIFPMLNPTAFSDSEYKMRNPDGIQVHHNFEVGHGENGAVQGDRYYGGATPLSIPETQYFDAVMDEYKDSLVCVLSCHNNVLDERHGTGVIWSSCATHFTCNLGFRFADKMSAAWREKHGAEVFDAGIRWANDFVLAQYENPTISDFEWMFDIITPERQEDWDYLIGRSNMSGSGGTEYRQALKYGIHGVNVEVCPHCMILDRDYNATNTSNAITMGTETYINYFRTFVAAYEPTDKKDYAPNLPWSE